jgi:hypothetical protein
MREDAGVLVRRTTRQTIAVGRFVAWGTWALMLVLVIGSLLLWFMDGQKPLPISFARGAIGVLSVAGCAVVFASLGAILGSQLARNPIGWMLLVIGMLFAFLTPVNLVIQRAFEVARPFPQTTLVMAWVMSSVMTPIIAGFILTVCLVFPDGRIPPGRWWIGAALALAGAILLAIASALEPTGLIWYPAVPNPAAVPGAYRPLVTTLRMASLVALVGGAAVSSAAVGVRYRRAHSKVRSQLRWILVGVATMTAGLLPFLVARYALQMSEEAGEVLIGVAAVSVCAFPISVALAIVRQRLFDIDQIISRTLVYVPLMGILAGVYTASVTLFQRIFISLTNDKSDAAIVISALILASVFAPVRAALEGRVNRHFKPSERASREHALGEPMPGIKMAPAPSRATVPPLQGGGPQPSHADIAARIAALQASLEELREIEEERVKAAGRPSAGESPEPGVGQVQTAREPPGLAPGGSPLPIDASLTGDQPARIRRAARSRGSR